MQVSFEADFGETAVQTETTAILFAGVDNGGPLLLAEKWLRRCQSARFRHRDVAKLIPWPSEVPRQPVIGSARDPIEVRVHSWSHSSRLKRS